MKTFARNVLGVALIAVAVQFAACTKSTGIKHTSISKERKLNSDSDSSYVAHIKVDSNHTDTLRYFTVYSYLTTKHGTTRLTTPINFSVSMTILTGSTHQTTGSVTILAGHTYGSTSFTIPTSFNYPLNIANLVPSPSSYNGIPITAQKDNGVFVP